MTIREAFERSRQSGRPLLLDAAMGTELTRRGADTAPPLWSARAILEAPELVRAIHEENAAAGADVLTADTFRTHERTVRGSGLDARERTIRAVALAREAARDAAREVWVAGSLAPLEDCYRPDLVPGEEDLVREHALQAESLLLAGVDLILVETMNTLSELLAAVRAATATGLGVAASVVTDGAGRLLSGEPLGDAGRALAGAGLDLLAFGVNCIPARLVAGELERLAAARPEATLLAYANTGRPTDTAGLGYTDPVSPEQLASFAREWIERGARLVGGCCGTTAAHTRALRSLLDPPGAPRGSSPGSSSPSASSP